ncbi:peptidylprolyl isomerase [Candidatus Cyanaurora vandensis]|uniref:peptidylprolyl isomerase n=1 Tax=Candidatus Cyanaurora vandensis TaxID=2714958 RepID=UPI00257D6528|nr:peptidylprolyl isomerase [Candidatus Cyanaurora vandensis]
MRRFIFGLAVLALVGCSTTPPASTISTAQAQAPAQTTEPDLTKGLATYAKKARVNLTTTQGLIVLEVDGENAPISAGNFLDLVKRGFYDGLTFHRVVPNFVIQGGDPKGDGTGGFVDPVTKRERTIPLEIKLDKAQTPTYGKVASPVQGSAPPVLKHQRGALAWARSQDPNSASSQFYITVADVNSLDGSYAVFGKVVEGIEVVDKIVAANSDEQVPTDKRTKIVKATVQ